MRTNLQRDDLINLVCGVDIKYGNVPNYIKILYDGVRRVQKRDDFDNMTSILVPTNDTEPKFNRDILDRMSEQELLNIYNTLKAAK